MIHKGDLGDLGDLFKIQMRVSQFGPGPRTGGGGGPRANRLRKDPPDPPEPPRRVLHSIWAVLSAALLIILIRILIKFISKRFQKKKP